MYWKIDLQTAVRKMGVTVLKGGMVSIDDQAFGTAVASGIAGVMRDNMNEGRRPDGQGRMPGRRQDGRPRGMGSHIVTTVRAGQGTGVYPIVADEESPGQMERILIEVPFRPPGAKDRTVVKVIDEARKLAVKTE
jgi:hypothetical protein